MSWNPEAVLRSPAASVRLPQWNRHTVARLAIYPFQIHTEFMIHLTYKWLHNIIKYSRIIEYNCINLFIFYWLLWTNLSVREHWLFVFSGEHAKVSNFLVTKSKGRTHLRTMCVFRCIYILKLMWMWCFSLLIYFLHMFALIFYQNLVILIWFDLIFLFL